jgi:hypothetical protein
MNALPGNGRIHNSLRADAIGAQQHDPGTPDMLLQGVAARDKRFKLLAIQRRNGE